MLFITRNNDDTIQKISTECSPIGANVREESRWDWDTMDKAEAVAAEMNEFDGAETYIATDSGAGVMPRFDIIKKPAIGDKISSAINGDYRPEGEIARISPTLKVVTSTNGLKFYRVKNSGSWVAHGCCSMIRGHHDERNPHI